MVVVGCKCLQHFYSVEMLVWHTLRDPGCEEPVDSLSYATAGPAAGAHEMACCGFGAVFVSLVGLTPWLPRAWRSWRMLGFYCVFGCCADALASKQGWRGQAWSLLSQVPADGEGTDALVQALSVGGWVDGWRGWMETAKWMDGWMGHQGRGCVGSPSRSLSPSLVPLPLFFVFALLQPVANLALPLVVLEALPLPSPSPSPRSSTRRSLPFTNTLSMLALL
jgi:hypothetical protein